MSFMNILTIGLNYNDTSLKKLIKASARDIGGVVTYSLVAVVSSLFSTYTLGDAPTKVTVSQSRRPKTVLSEGYINGWLLDPVKKKFSVLYPKVETDQGVVSGIEGEWTDESGFTYAKARLKFLRYHWTLTLEYMDRVVFKDLFEDEVLSRGAEQTSGAIGVELKNGLIFEQPDYPRLGYRNTTLVTTSSEALRSIQRWVGDLSGSVLNNQKTLVMLRDWNVDVVLIPGVTVIPFSKKDKP